MDQPKTYNASVESVPPVVHEPAPEMPKIDGDPLNAFEAFHFQMQANLRNWMTYDPASRETAVRSLSTMSSKSADELKLTPARIVKSLCYIIWLERVHPSGDYKVAVIAFKALWDRLEQAKTT